ncbi:MAG TPA: amino acid adenylation domain-containing protein [Candidatus Binatia bacterium]|jgi:amino acid adenylation domain-containing protein
MNTQDIEDIYELSSLQQGILFHSLEAPQSGIYCMRLSYALRGSLDVRTFERAWQHVIDRHPILRTSFHWQDLAKPLQVVHKKVELKLESHDWRMLSHDERADRIKAYIEEEGRRGFRFTEAPLMRLAVFRSEDEAYHLIWSFHHALLDGGCKSLILKEVFESYEALRHDRPLTPNRPRPYRDYILWLQQQDLVSAEKFWRKELEGFTAPTALGVERAEAAVLVEEEVYNEQHVRMSQAATAAVQSIARRHHLTLNTLMQGVWAILLSHYSGEADVLFGATVSNRPADLEGMEQTAGLFINTLPVRVRVDWQAPLLSWLKELQAHQARARQYDYTSLLDIQGWTEVPRGRRLFETILAFENFLDDRRQQLSGLEARFERAYDWSNYPLGIEVLPGSELLLAIIYDSRRFAEDTVARMLGHLQTLLQGIINAPESRLADLPLLTDKERHQLLVDWNATARSYPRDQSLHELFEMQVERTPEAVAVALDERQLTYQELNRRSNQLAHYLNMLGVGPEVLVGLCVERSLEMVVGILAILKAGGAYVPLDPVYPTERLAFMLEDARVAVVLTQERLSERVASHGLPQGRAIRLDADWELIAQQSDQNPQCRTVPENLAYVIYTSGSTGRPKGAMIRQQGLINYLTWCAQAYPMADGQGAVVHSSIAFDLTVTGLFAPLLQGRRVTLVREELGMEGLSAALAKEHDLSLIKITPSHLQLLGRQLAPENAAGRTRAFIIGGENLLPEHIAFWQEHAPETALINEYGPTETVVGCCVYRARNDEPMAASVPIGRPIINTQLYILDERLAPVPIGVTGELYISGAGVARGYLNRPDLTAERFLPDPFSAETGTRMYKTGDLARYLANGNIECRGRADHQVKIRGFRVELGEIESVLSQHPAVRESVVVAREDVAGDRMLVAYWVGAEEPAISPAELQNFLKQTLPDYMIPAAFVALDTLPLTANGKVDRRALPEPGQLRSASQENYEAPRTTMESLIAEIWQDVLHVDRVGVQDNFFDLGGHSLLCLPVMARLEKELGIRITPRDLILQTLGQLATACETRQQAPGAKPAGLRKRMLNVFRRAVS